MRFSHWFRCKSQPAPSFRPTFDLLEDRVVPVVLRPGAPLPTPPHLQVIVPQHVEAGKAFQVVVRALDANNRVVPSFKGTVQLSLVNADPGAALPTSFTFAARNAGKHTFQVTLTSIGTQTVKATSARLTAQAPLTVGAPATHFSVSAFGQATVGTQTIFNVTALDANNQVVPGYVGKVRFSSTDVYAGLPADYTFTAADRGSRLFQVTFATAGNRTVAVTDTANGSLAGGTSIKVSAPRYYYGGYFNPFGYYPNYGYFPMTGTYSGYGAWGSPWF